MQEFVVNGDWAFERYAYKSTDTPVGGGAVVEDTGWGLVISPIEVAAQEALHRAPHTAAIVTALARVSATVNAERYASCSSGLVLGDGVAFTGS